MLGVGSAPTIPAEEDPTATAQRCGHNQSDVSHGSQKHLILKQELFDRNTGEDLRRDPGDKDKRLRAFLSPPELRRRHCWIYRCLETKVSPSTPFRSLCHNLINMTHSASHLTI